jgi:plasmid stabilization system protein ParE
MIYTVIWKPFAERALTDIWTSSRDRSAVRDAADAIDSALRNTPYRVGESRAANVRVVVASPLAVRYAVFEADRIVEVYAVWRTQKS